MTSSNDMIINWLRSTLRAVLRICLRNSIKLHDVVEAVKIVYVEVAREELKTQGEKESASRLAAMTGVHRQDIARFSKTDNEFKPRDNTLARIVVQWQHDQRFLTKAGKPRVLEAEGRDSEFAELVESVNGGNLSAYAVLFELERMGAIKKSGSRVKLVWRDFAPKPDSEQGLQLLAEDTNELISAVEENIFSETKAKNLHLKTKFTCISEQALPEVRAWLIKQGSLFHKQIEKYLSKYDADLNPSLNPDECKATVSYGSFSLISDEASLLNNGEQTDEKA